MKNLSFNFIKGIFIGMGAVLPGLSGGALAAIFGVYEPLIKFVSNIKKDFKTNVKFFLPLFFGALLGIFLLSHALSYLLEYHLPVISIFFVGTMLGVFPALVKKAGAKGREPIHIVLAIAVSIFSFLILTTASVSTVSQRTTAVHVSTWVASGGLIGLGITFPGLSPSNFLMYFDLYQPLNEAISQLNFTILIPVAIGGFLSVVVTAKIVAYLLTVAYTVLYHVILGFVLTSIVMILPRNFGSPLMIGIFLILGLIVGTFMSRLEEKVPARIESALICYDHSEYVRKNRKLRNKNRGRRF